VFDNIYGPEAVGTTNDARGRGWVANTGEFKSMIIDGITKQAHYVYLDLSVDTQTAIITSFQFYCIEDSFPIEYHIVGSNDELSWTSLYHTENAFIKGTYPERDGKTGAFSYKHETTKQDTHFKYIGISIISHNDPTNRATIQELLLYGVEPVIDVVEKIEQVVRGPDIKTLIQDYIYSVFEVFNKRTGLTNGDLVTTSGNQSGSSGGFLAFNGIYGDDVSGWISDTNKNDLTIDGTEESGYYIYVDVSFKPIIKSFQLWSAYYGQPRDFYILGYKTNDSTWTKLYDSNDTDLFTNTIIGSSKTKNKAHTDIIQLDNNTEYQYIGLFVLSAVYGNDTLYSNASCQEFRLFTV
jgi:hypothetical protein